MAPRVVLVGPMGAGKTAVGALLASRLGVGLRDTDADVEAAAGRSVAEVFAAEGEAGFRRREQDAVRAALAGHDGVLALGGGAVLSPQVRAALAGHAVVLLRASWASVADRVARDRVRPLLAGEPQERWEALLAARRPLYEQVATAVVDTDGLAVEQVADRVLAALERPGGVLVFTRTLDYRHESIPDGVRAVTALAAERGLAVQHTEDPAVFTAGLASARVVVWLSTSGSVLDPAQREAFAAWLRGGGAFAGIHAATTAENDWPEFERIIGAFFASHPELQTAVVRVEDPDHPSTACLPPGWAPRDEWYDFTTHPRGRVHVLATVDESTYSGGLTGGDHPVVWSGTYGLGRTWYTALGHEPAAYRDPVFLAHLRGGLGSLWGTGPEPRS